LEDFSYRYHLITRKVTIRNGSFRVYAWHPRPWVMEDTPPISWMLDRVSPEDVVYDIGANRGYFTLALLSNISGVRIFPFEPNPEVMAKLKANLRLNKDKDYVRPVKYALGAEGGTTTLNISWVDSASSIRAVHAEDSGHGIRSTVEIQVKTLDKLVFEEHFPAPQHIKIDTEGFEVPVLLGAKETISQYRPFAYIEVHTINGSQDNEQDIRQALYPHGYSIQRYRMQLLCAPDNKRSKTYS